MPRPHSNVPGNDANPDLRLLRLVESFEDGWVAGSPIPLEDWLAAAGDDDRDELFHHGLAVEVAHRRLRGETPTAGDYLDRFPDRPSIIHEALAEAPPRSDPGPSGASWPHAGGTVLETLALGRSHAARPAGRRPGRCRAPGGLAVVARDARAGGPPRARAAPGRDRPRRDGGRAQGSRSRPRPRPGRQGPARGASRRPDLIRRFIEEAQIAGQLQHPGIVPGLRARALRRPPAVLHHEARQGPDPRRPAGRADGPAASELPRFLGIFVQVCQTVAYAHARGVDPPRPQAIEHHGGRRSARCR